MKRYAALLRGVSPMNARMPQLARAFEAAGFAQVRTVLSSGNVVFSTAPATETALQRRAEGAMQAQLGRTFMTVVRSVEALQSMVDDDPFARFDLTGAHKRVVTFLLSEPKDVSPLPIEVDGARVLAVQGREVFSAYLPGPKGPVFMSLIERTFGKDVTTRTWDTVRKVCAAR